MLSLSSQFRRWFEYERDSHAKAFSSLAAVPEGLRSSNAFQQAATLLAHISAARQLWLHRLGVTSEIPREFFPKVDSLADLDTRLKATERAWSNYLDGLDDAGLARVFEYRSQEGEWYRNTIQDVLTQLFGHSLYHRGQIAALIRSLGCEPAATDFIFWTREMIPGPPAAAPQQLIGTG
jgi:uncharacterized damage-inducible protein DinB